MSTFRWFGPFLILLSYPSNAQVTDVPVAATVESVCLSEILIRTPEPYDPAQIAAAQSKADTAREAIGQGAKFEDTAKKYSDGPSAALGGAVGLFKRGQLAKSLEDRVFAMKVGDVSDVIRTKQGFTILKVAECHPVARLGGKQDYGLGVSAPTGKPLGGVDILSDTHGVDFGPYLQHFMQVVRKNWYALIPQSSQMKKGKLAIELAITPDGKVADMKLVATSGDVALDRPAWASITSSNPFPALPREFTGPYLALRLHFYYNPDKVDRPETIASKQKENVAISISPASDMQVTAGASARIDAKVTGTDECEVEWNVTGSGCSGTACGTITGDLYIAPDALPSPPLVTVTAISKADPTKKASVNLRIVERAR